jgi:hypothetical protein
MKRSTNAFTWDPKKYHTKAKRKEKINFRGIYKLKAVNMKIIRIIE